MTLLNLSVAICHVHWHASYIKSTRTSHKPLYHNIAVVLYVYLMEKYASANADIERNKKTKESAPAQSAYIDGVAILKSDVVRNENGAFAVLSWRHSRYALPVSRHYHAAQPNAGRDVSFFSVISTTSLWHLRLWRQWPVELIENVGRSPGESKIAWHRYYV